MKRPWSARSLLLAAVVTSCSADPESKRMGASATQRPCARYGERDAPPPPTPAEALRSETPLLVPLAPEWAAAAAAWAPDALARAPARHARVRVASRTEVTRAQGLAAARESTLGRFVEGLRNASTSPRPPDGSAAPDEMLFDQSLLCSDPAAAGLCARHGVPSGCVSARELPLHAPSELVERRLVEVATTPFVIRDRGYGSFNVASARREVGIDDRVRFDPVGPHLARQVDRRAPRVAGGAGGAGSS